MNMRHPAALIIVVLAVTLLRPNVALAQDDLAAAKDLYASAAYDDALSLLTKLKAANGPATDAVSQAQIDEYRAFCLIAIGKTPDAQALIDSLIRSNPRFQPDADAASPRIQAMFADARKRLLPDVIVSKYRTARTSLDRKDYAAALPQLEDVSGLLADAERSGLSSPTLTDLGVLVDGFIQLAKTVHDQTVQDQKKVAEAVVASPAVPAPKKSVPPVPKPFYVSTDAGIVAPQTITEKLPKVPANIATSVYKPVVVDVLIDEHGSVDRVTVREPVNALYDNFVLSAAREWKYRPATHDGVPVKYLKTVAVNVAQ